MTPYQKRVTAFTKRMAEDMQRRGSETKLERVKPCPHCQGAMQCIVKEARPKWRELFYGPEHPPWFEWTSRGLCSPPDDTIEAASHVEDAPDPDWDPGPDLFDQILASRLE